MQYVTSLHMYMYMYMHVQLWKVRYSLLKSVDAVNHNTVECHHGNRSVTKSIPCFNALLDVWIAELTLLINLIQHLNQGAIHHKELINQKITSAYNA